MRVFIDTNIYLKLFHFPGDGATYLDKLIKLIGENKVSVVFPKIIQNEIFRNIDSFTATYKKQIESTKVKKPEFKEIHDKESRSKIEEAFKLWTEATEELNRKYLDNIEKVKNKIFQEFVKYSKDFKELPKLVRLANERKLKGYPPGKRSHIGDELSWEILKYYCNNKQLTIISFDSDWDNGNEDNKGIHPFLKEEWKEVSKHEITFYNSLGQFLKQFPIGESISEKEISSEKQSGIPWVYPVDSDKGFTFYTPPNFGAVSPISTPSVNQWQPINVVGSVDVVQCFSCGRWVNRNDYYGLTLKGFACKFCEEI